MGLTQTCRGERQLLAGDVDGIATAAGHFWNGPCGLALLDMSAGPGAGARRRTRYRNNRTESRRVKVQFAKMPTPAQGGLTELGAERSENE